MWSAAIARAHRMAPVCVAALVFALLAALAPSAPITDDDDFYIPAGVRMFDWGVAALRQPQVNLARDAVDATFALNHEHPPLAKWVLGATARISTWCGGAMLVGARLGSCLFTALIAWCLMVRAPRRAGGLMAVGLLLSLPRFLFHAQVPTLDVPVSSTIMLTMAVACTRLHARGWRPFLWVGTCFGLALLTKLNAPFCVLPLLAVWWWENPQAVGVHQRGLLVPMPPSWLLGCMVLGPLLFVVAWPWLWFDTAQRLQAYAAFHLKHYPILFFFDGVVHHQQVAGGVAPLRMAIAVMPLPFLLVLIVGISRVPRAWMRLRARGSVHDRWLVLCALQAMVSIVVVSLPGVPTYGGEKLFMPFFPCAAVVAGVGCMHVWRCLRVIVLRHRRFRSVVVRTMAVVFALAALLPGVMGSIRTRGGYALSYYGPFVGGLRGAVARGHESTYYDVATNDLADWLYAHAAGMRIHVAPNHKEYVRAHRWWQLTRNGSLVLEDKLAEADIVVLMDEARWTTLPALQQSVQAWREVASKQVDGVTLWRVLVRPGRHVVDDAAPPP
jgi:predicted membrane-bound dolichyl-phosphate-mannose-protein mannosyltransferase